MQVLLDESTGAFSWEAFSAFATLTAAHTMRREGSLSLLVLALDVSRDIMQRFDPGLEEVAVRIAAGVLMHTSRAGDMVGRHGPSSFAILAQDAQQAGAMRLAERIHASLPDQMTVGSQSVRLTASVGIASLPQAGGTLPELLQVAENALREATVAGGNQVRIGSPIARPAAPEGGHIDERGTRQEQLAAQRSIGLKRLTQAVERGEIEGIALQALSSACPVCLDAARDLYRPGWAPPLPLTGCTGPVGCRCTYGSPLLDPRRRLPAAASSGLSAGDLPRRLRDAARFGSEPKGSCKPEDLAEYLEVYPVLPLSVEFELLPEEQVYLLRPARRAWEQPSPASAATHGPVFPIAAPAQPWLKTLGRPPQTPNGTLLFKDEGVLCVTNQRLLFRRRETVDAMQLLDISTIEYFRDGIALSVTENTNRLFFLVRDPLQVGLLLTRALRDALFPSR